MNTLYKLFFTACMGITCFSCTQQGEQADPVDLVNPYMGNISHLLVPAYPTIHLPNSMLRVYPERDDYTSDQIKGLPLIVTSHRGCSAFKLSPVQTTHPEELQKTHTFTYDNEEIKPYGYQVILDEKETYIKYAVSHQAGIYEINYTRDEPVYLILSTDDGYAKVEGNKLYASQKLANNTQVYIYVETDKQPLKTGNITEGKGIDENTKEQNGRSGLGLYFGDNTTTIRLKYGISFISIDQAAKNMHREIPDFNLAKVEKKGRECWNKALRKIEVKGNDTNDLIVFYSSLYRTFERPVRISEDGHYFSAFDGKVHKDEGIPFYTDDWIWDSYRAAHPLRLLIDPTVHSHVINSLLRMTDQMEQPWMPTFPEITGDSRRMNSNHGVSLIADAYAKGLTTFDLAKAYTVCKKGIQEKTLAPWSGAPAGWLDDFYKKHGYIPALHPGEEETVPEVYIHEKRQPIAVTLGTAYDEWCLAQIASYLGKQEEKQFFLKQSYNYRHVYNPDTHFFHPKDKNGQFIEPFNYKFSGGQGARDYYGENNGWIYRWDVPHNVADLIQLMGGAEAFEANLEQTFREPLGRSKFDFYHQLPDHTGNVG